VPGVPVPAPELAASAGLWSCRSGAGSAGASLASWRGLWARSGDLCGVDLPERL